MPWTDKQKTEMEILQREVGQIVDTGELKNLAEDVSITQAEYNNARVSVYKEMRSNVVAVLSYLDFLIKACEK